MLVATRPFEALARETAASYRAPALRLLGIEHPLGAIAPALVRERADAAIEAALALFARGAAR